MSDFDPRITLARRDLAAAALEGLVAAERYEATTPARMALRSSGIHRSGDPSSERMDELIYGETFDILGQRGAYVFGQARRDGYVGWVDQGDLVAPGEPRTHWVRALRSFAFTGPSIKTRPVGPFSLNALVRVIAAEGPFSRDQDGFWFWTGHLAPIGQVERDPAAVAEQFLGAPYLWGGRTSVGLDCSGLVQQALYACGRACPRDTDQQAALGRAIAPAALTRGDLVCWKGHIGMMLDAARLLHANAHHMCVAIEPLAEAIARIGPPTTLRRT
jgi:hypothetical protein